MSLLSDEEAITDSYVTYSYDEGKRLSEFSTTLDSLGVRGPGRPRTEPERPPGARKDAAIKFFLPKFRKYCNEKFPRLRIEQPYLWKHFFRPGKLPPSGKASWKQSYLKLLFGCPFFRENFEVFFEENGRNLVQKKGFSPERQEYYLKIGRERLCKFNLRRVRKNSPSDGAEFDRAYLVDDTMNCMEGDEFNSEEIPKKRKQSRVFDNMSLTGDVTKDPFEPWYKEEDGSI